MWKLLTVAMVLFLASCGSSNLGSQGSLKDREVPTAFFLFFPENSAEPLDGDKQVLNEVAAFMKYYDTLSVRIVGHSGSSEVSPIAVFPLDVQRSTYVAGELVNRGISSSRLGVLNVGSREAMASVSGGDESVDRRVEIMVTLGAPGPVQATSAAMPVNELGQTSVTPAAKHKSSAASKNAVIMVGSFSREAAANSAVASLAKINLKGEIKTFKNKGVDFWAVRVTSPRDGATLEQVRAIGFPDAFYQ